MLTKIIAVATFSLVLGPVSAVAADLPGFPFIHTSGTASVSTVADVGDIDLEVVLAGADSAAVWSGVEEKIRRIRELAEQQGAGVVEIETQNLSRGVRRTGESNPSAAPVGEVRAALHLTVRDLRVWTALVSSLVAMPGIEGLTVAFSRSDIRKIESELVAQAVADAHRQAEMIAKGFGRRAGEVKGVSTGSLKNISNALGMATSDLIRLGIRSSAPKNTKDMDINLIGMVRLSQSVDVVFGIR